jgi:hypothetical protein
MDCICNVYGLYIHYISYIYTYIFILQDGWKIFDERVHKLSLRNWGAHKCGPHHQTKSSSSSQSGQAGCEECDEDLLNRRGSTWNRALELWTQARVEVLQF